MIIVAGSLTVAAQVRDGYLHKCRELIAAARSSPGCLDFHLSADPLDDVRINVYERWSGRPELDTFRGSGPSDGQHELIVAADVREYICDREIRL